MRRTSSATLELPEDTRSCYIVFPYLVYGEPTPSCLSIVGLRVVQQVATLESCETFLFSSDFSEPYISRPISCCIISVLLPVLARVHLLVIFLHCMLQSSVALPLCGGSSCCWGLGALAYLYFACRVFMAFHADQCGLEGGTENGVSSLGSCVPSTEELYLPCYLTQLPWHLYVASGGLESVFSFSRTNCLTRLSSLVYLGFGITVFLLLGQLPVKANEFGPHWLCIRWPSNFGP